MTNWSVVCTVKSTEIYLTRFIEHYAKLGAYEIFIYFDDPARTDHCRDTAAHKVVITICDSAYWGEKVVKNENIESRQILNFLDAKSKTKSDWLLHVDVDELLFARAQVSKVLSKLPDTTFSVLVKPLEAVWENPPHTHNVFDTPWFRRALSYRKLDVIERVFAPEIASLTRNGLFGHLRGKSFTNTHHDIARAGIHFCKPKNKALDCNVNTKHLDLLHFEAMTYEDWKQRALARMSGQIVALRMSDSRKIQMALIASTYKTQGDQGLLELYNAMNVFNPSQLRDARRLGFVVERRLNAIPTGLWQRMKDRFISSTY